MAAVWQLCNCGRPMAHIQHVAWQARKQAVGRPHSGPVACRIANDMPCVYSLALAAPPPIPAAVQGLCLLGIYEGYKA